MTDAARALVDEELAGWARNWHWNDCADDKHVDPSIYFRDMRMLKAFLEFAKVRSPQPMASREEVARIIDPDANWNLPPLHSDYVNLNRENARLKSRREDALKKADAILSLPVQAALPPMRSGE